MTVEIDYYGFVSTDYETPDNYQGDDVIAINPQADGQLKLTLRSRYTNRRGDVVTTDFFEYIPAGMWSKAEL